MTAMANLRMQEGVEQEKDSLGGGGYLVESDVYNSIVTMAYLSTSKTGAMAMNLELKTEDDSTIRETLWMTSGTAKGCLPYYEKDGRKYPLPGFTVANSLTLLTVGKQVGDLATEKKVIKKYDPEQRKEVNTEVDVFMDLLNKPVKAGVIKKIIDKTALNQVTNEYEPTGETREVNEIDKFFRAADSLTVPEIQAGETQASFINDWADKHTGVTQNKAKGQSANKAGVNTGMPGATAMGNSQASSEATSTTSLFG